MNEIKAVRERLGFSQGEFAAFLGVDRSTLAHAETSRRELPTKAYLRFARLSRLEFDIEPQPHANLLSDPILHDGIQSAFADAIAQTEMHLQRLKKQLADAEARLNQHARRVQWLARLTAEPPTNPNDVQRETTFIQYFNTHTANTDTASLYIRICKTKIAIETKQLELKLLKELAK